MIVYYKGERWEARLTLRDNLLSLLRETYPEKLIEITQGWRRKFVEIKQLKTEAEWRNG